MEREISVGEERNAGAQALERQGRRGPGAQRRDLSIDRHLLNAPL